MECLDHRLEGEKRFCWVDVCWTPCTQALWERNGYKLIASRAFLKDTIIQFWKTTLVRKEKMIKTVAYSREDECNQKMAINNVHDDFNHVPRRQQTFPNRILVQSKTTTAAYSLQWLSGLCDCWLASAIADWSLLLLIVFPDCWSVAWLLIIRKKSN